MSKHQIRYKVVKITEVQFFDQFKPIKNLLNENASYDGYMFDSFDEQFEFIVKTLAENHLKVWTLIKVGEDTIICQGYHFVDRIGYIVTEFPAKANTEYIIQPEVFDVILEGNAQSIYEIDMTDIFDYNTPDEIDEWTWLKTNASYKHTGNGHAGIWEFMLNMANEFIDVPASFEKYISEAKSKNIAYLLFHQGT